MVNKLLLQYVKLSNEVKRKIKSIISVLKVETRHIYENTMHISYIKKIILFVQKM